MKTQPIAFSSKRGTICRSIEGKRAHQAQRADRQAAPRPASNGPRERQCHCISTPLQDTSEGPTWPGMIQDSPADNIAPSVHSRSTRAARATSSQALDLA